MQVGPYEVLSEIGRGGLGIVYRVRRPSGGEAALKLLVKVDPEKLGHFERERRILAALGEEKGFVGILDSGDAPEGPWILMPFVPGGTLRKRLEAGPLPVEEALALGLQLARALGAAHERGIVHRDVKPENVIFTGGPGAEPPNERWSGRALLADLGLAKHFDRSAPGASQSHAVTETGKLLGTAGYTAPEQLSSATAVGPPADVFALGAVLYECLAGRPAFPGRTVLDIMGKVDAGRVEKIDRPEVPPWLEEVVARALATDPRARFADGAGLARALERGARRRVPRFLVALIVLGALAGGVHIFVRHLRAREARELLASVVMERDAARLEAVATRALALDPGLAAAWRQRSFARRLRGDAKGALADALRATELDPEDPFGWEARAGALGDLRALDEALAAANVMIEVAPRNARSWSARAAIRNWRHEFEGGRDDAAHAIELDPSLAPAWASRAQARSFLGDASGELADATRALELDPAFALAWTLRAEARMKKRDLAGALADATRAVELVPGHASCWYTRGAARSALGDLIGAEDDCSRAVQLDPRDPGGWALRSQVRLRRHDPRALSDAEEAVRVDPLVAMTWSERGVARDGRGDLEGALADFTKALTLGPGLALCWVNRGATRFKLGDREGARADLDRALELAPELPEAWVERGKVRLPLDPAGALEDLERAIALSPRSASAWTLLGTAHGRLGQLETALADLGKALEIEPENLLAWRNRAGIRYRLGDGAGARKDLERFLELNPGDAQARAELEGMK